LLQQSEGPLHVDSTGLQQTLLEQNPPQQSVDFAQYVPGSAQQVVFMHASPWQHLLSVLLHGAFRGRQQVPMMQVSMQHSGLPWQDSPHILQQRCSADPHMPAPAQQGTPSGQDAPSGAQHPPPTHHWGCGQVVWQLPQCPGLVTRSASQPFETLPSQLPHPMEHTPTSQAPCVHFGTAFCTTHALHALAAQP
jgi:hypothetical protein